MICVQLPMEVKKVRINMQSQVMQYVVEKRLAEMLSPSV